LNAVARVDAVFGHGGCVWLIQTDVAPLLLGPGLDGTAGLPDVDMTELAGHAVHTRSLGSQVTLYRPKETGDLLRGLAHRLGVVLGQQLADVIKIRAHVGQEGD
jgi:hypothetical protein